MERSSTPSSIPSKKYPDLYPTSKISFPLEGKLTMDTTKLLSKETLNGLMDILTYPDGAILEIDLFWMRIYPDRCMQTIVDLLSKSRMSECGQRSIYLLMAIVYLFTLEEFSYLFEDFGGKTKFCEMFSRDIKKLLESSPMLRVLIGDSLAYLTKRYGIYFE